MKYTMPTTTKVLSKDSKDESDSSEFDGEEFESQRKIDFDLPPGTLVEIDYTTKPLEEKFEKDPSLLLSGAANNSTLASSGSWPSPKSIRNPNRFGLLSEGAAMFIEVVSIYEALDARIKDEEKLERTKKFLMEHNAKAKKLLDEQRASMVATFDSDKQWKSFKSFEDDEAKLKESTLCQVWIQDDKKFYQNLSPLFYKIIKLGNSS